MWNSLIAGMLGLLSPDVQLPQPQQLESDVGLFAQHFDLDSSRVQITSFTKDNPSPFLTRASNKQCTIYINHDNSAKMLWHYLVGNEDAEFGDAFTRFSMGHELTHCMLAEPGKRTAYRQQLEDRTGVRFTDNRHFEESLGDLMGLAYVQKTRPDQYAAVSKKLRDVRTNFASRDKEHDSTPVLKPQIVAWVSEIWGVNINRTQVAQASGLSSASANSRPVVQ